MDKKILLIADDDEMSRRTISRFLSDTFEVIEAADGEEALEILHNRRVDAVILDIIMPKCSGFDVLQQVKCDEKYSDLRILVATSLLEKTERRALELGADDLVFKPYDPVVIKKRLNNLVTMQDQKRELEQALLRAEQANQAKTDFLSRISHDMRTPLNGILGITALMKDRMADPAQQRDLQELEMSGQYLLNLINDTLDVNKIEAGKLELHPDVYDGRTAINNVINLIRPAMEEKRIHFDLRAEGLPFTMLYMDMGRMEQVILNILGNAVKFTPAGGTIEAGMTNLSNDGKIIRDRIVIKDNGVGMSKEFLPHLFEPFTQENPGRTGNTSGTGLGMTITKQIVELMGGTIAVESTPGKGTTFTIEIPLPVATPDQVTAWRARRHLDVSHYQFEGKRVLLCEDHPLNAEIAIRLLKKKGILADHAENGQVGLDMFENSQQDYYDLILMDIRMPVMDGLQAAKAIRALQRPDAQRIPIVAMTANAFEEDVEETRKVGMNDHLGKPIEVEKLYRCLAEMLQLKYQRIKRGVLIVDDVEVNRAAMMACLGDEFELYEASDGRRALQVLENQPGIDLVITDIQMPGMDGFLLIKSIREEKKYDHVAIIANTQFGDPEQEEAILALGADDFVYKPTTPKIVELRVRNIMNRV